MALFTKVQHLCTFSIIVPRYLSAFAKCLEGVVHHQRVNLCWCPVLTAIYHGLVHLLCWTGSLTVVLSLWRRDRIRMDSSGEFGGCSRIFHCQSCKSSSAAMWLLAFPWRITRCCITKCRLSFLGPCEYDRSPRSVLWESQKQSQRSGKLHSRTKHKPDGEGTTCSSVA